MHMLPKRIPSEMFVFQGNKTKGSRSTDIITSETTKKATKGSLDAKPTSLAKKPDQHKHHPLTWKLGKGLKPAPTVEDGVIVPESDSDEDGPIMRNPVGDIPMEWYKDEKHIGYDLKGKKIIK